MRFLTITFAVAGMVYLVAEFTRFASTGETTIWRWLPLLLGLFIALVEAEPAPTKE